MVAVSLLLSWLLSQTITPLMCMRMLPDPKGDGTDPYDTPFYARYRHLLGLGIRFRGPVLAGLVGLLLVSLWSFQFVPQLFFPDSSREQFMIDYWLDEGTRIHETSERIKAIEQELLEHPKVTDVATFVGQGPPRFYLPVDPEMAYPSYAQLVVNTESYDDVATVMAHIEPWLTDNTPEAIVRVRKYGVGSWNDWKFEARFSGPWNADPDTLRRLGQEGVAILDESPLAMNARTNWRSRVRKLVPEYAQERGRWSNISRDDVADATRRAYDGVAVGQYREDDSLIPIVIRNIESERLEAAANMGQLQVVPALSTSTVPLDTVTHGVDVRWEDSVIHRFDRRRAITVQGSPRGVTFPQLLAEVRESFESIELPPGFSLDWDGELKTSAESQRGLLPGLAPTVVIMTLIIVMLFNAFRPPVIIFAVIPFAAIGITWGLLLTRIPFGFMSLLGAMSLAGMMIKNSVVLLDEVNVNARQGMQPYDAVVEAAVSRLRPVLNAAATTVLGIAPLLTDVFWVSMSITIMSGLAFGTLLTMVVVPILYATLYQIPAQDTPA